MSGPETPHTPPIQTRNSTLLNVGAAIFLFALVILVPTISDYGVTWDEANPNFPAARNQEDWFRRLLTTGRGLNEADVRKGFETDSDHPSLPRTWMALSRLVLPGAVPDRVAFALPTSVAVGLFSCFFFLYLKRRFDWPASVGAPLLLLLHPRWFAHSHFAEYDVPIAIAWCLAALSFLWANDEKIGSKEAWKRSLWAGFLMGFALSIKIHALFLPFPFLVWSVLFRKWGAWRWAVASAVFAPLVYIGTQPYLWWDTLGRLSKRFLDYSEKVPIAVHYLGFRYPGDLPWHYAWVMLAITLPVLLSIFAAMGLVRFAQQVQGRMWASGLFQWLAFVFLNAIAIPLVFTWRSPYDGIRLLLVSLPFLALLAAAGIDWGQTFLVKGFGIASRPVAGGIVAFAVVAQVWSCYVYHPYQLSFYSDLVGGLRGATQLGFESTYWCESIDEGSLGLMVELLGEEANIATHAMDPEVLLERQRDGTLPKAWTFNAPGSVDARIIQFRQGFFLAAENALVNSDRKILVERGIEGVPLMRVYAGP